jgi:hypothetical protein
MKKMLLPGLLFTAALFLFACGASVKMTSSWMDDSKAGYKINNVLVVGISREDITRNLWENTFVEQLGKQNIRAQAGHIVMGGQEIKPDRESILAAVRKSGVDAVLITRVVGRESETKTSGGVVSSPAPYYMGMYDYYGYAHNAVYTAPVDYRETTVRLESNLYDVASEKLIWTAQSEAVNANLVKTDYAKMINLLLHDMRSKKLF